METLSYFFFLVSSVCIIICIASHIILIFTVGNKFDKLFRSVSPVFDPQIPGISKSCRTIVYSILIAFKNKVSKKKEFYKKYLYGDYNFYKNASFFEFLLSRTYVFSGTFGIFTATFWTVLK